MDGTCSTHPQIRDVGERIGVAAVVDVNNNIREIELLGTPEGLRLVLRAKLL